MRFSASRIKKYMECPKQADFHYNYGYPSRQSGKASFGSIVHHCLELYNQTRNVDLALATFKDQWLNPPDGLEPDWWPKFTSYQGLRQRGIEIITKFHEQTKWDTREVIATEHPFLVRFGEHELTGFVDLLEIRTSGKGKNLLRIVDYKCMALGTPVLMAHGGVRPVEKVRVGDLVVGSVNGVLRPTRVEDVHDNGVVPCVRITTGSGRRLDVTANHPMWTMDGWVAAGELNVCRSARAHDGHWVGVGLEWEGTSTASLPDGEAWLLGALVGDGCLSEKAGSLGFTNTDERIVDRARSVTEGLGMRFVRQGTSPDYRLVQQQGGARIVRPWRDRHELWGTSRTKVVPGTVTRGTPVEWVGFLAGLLDTDGSVRLKPSATVTWHSVNRSMLQQCQTMLANLGINGRLETIRSPHVKEGVSHRLTVADAYGCGRLAEILGTHVVGHKSELLSKVPQTERPERYGWDAVVKLEHLPAQQTIGLQVGCSTHVTGGLISHNTASRMPNMAALALDPQFSVYAYASQQPEFWTGWPSDGTDNGDRDAAKFPGMPNGAWLEEFYRGGERRNIWYHLWTAKEIDAGGRDERDFQQLYRTMVEIHRSIEANIYIPRIGDACSWCDYTEPCGVYVPTKEELASEDFAWI